MPIEALESMHSGRSAMIVKPLKLTKTGTLAAWLCFASQAPPWNSLLAIIKNIAIVSISLVPSSLLLLLGGVLVLAVVVLDVVVVVDLVEGHPGGGRGGEGVRPGQDSGRFCQVVVRNRDVLARDELC